MCATLYTPLRPSRKEIRLLTILEGAQSDEIECLLSTVSLADKPVYIALSYTWGDQQAPDPVKTNGLPVSTTANLQAAMRRLRRED